MALIFRSTVWGTHPKRLAISWFVNRSVFHSAHRARRLLAQSIQQSSTLIGHVRRKLRSRFCAEQLAAWRSARSSGAKREATTLVETCVVLRGVKAYCRRIILRYSAHDADSEGRMRCNACEQGGAASNRTRLFQSTPPR
jgi:hypothetical protein